MGPRRRRFWLPLTRLGAFFAAVVVGSNVVLYAFRPAISERPSTPDESVDYYARKRRRIERQIYRTIEMFWGPSRAASEKIKVGEAPEPVKMKSVLRVVPAAQIKSPLLPIAAPVPHSAPAPRPELLGYLEPEAAPFVWPESLKPPSASLPDLSRSLGLEEPCTFRTGMVEEFYRRASSDPLADVGDAILRAPEFLFDEIFTCANGMGSRPATRLWDDDLDRCVTARILDIQIGPRTNRIWSEFMNQFAQREMNYLGNFGDSRVDTVQFEDRTSSADYHELMLDERKVFWDALRRTYLSRYKVQSDERIRDEAWYLDRWSGADFAILPPLLGAYVFYRGLDRRFTIGGTQVLLSVEPVSEWYRPTKHDLAAALALEWTMKGLPLGVIVSAGLHESRYGMDFVGVGTSLGAVRRALVMQQQQPERW